MYNNLFLLLINLSYVTLYFGLRVYVCMIYFPLPIFCFIASYLNLLDFIPC